MILKIMALSEKQLFTFNFFFNRGPRDKRDIGPAVKRQPQSIFAR